MRVRDAVFGMREVPCQHSYYYYLLRAGLMGELQHAGADGPKL